MKKGEKSSYDGIENFLCPFTDMYITQGAGEGNHKGIMAVDVRGKSSGVKYPYYAPCTVKCVRTYPSSGQVMWQSTSDVRCANGYIGVVTFMSVHDDSMDAVVGRIYPQGSQLGNMGRRGNATGVHCHLEISQGSDTSWFKNKYGVYQFRNEVDIDDACFFDDTNILNRKQYLKIRNTNNLVKRQYVNLPANIDTWAIYKINSSPVKKNAIAYLKPSKFGGLTYKIIDFLDKGKCVSIETRDYGRVKIYVYKTSAIISDKIMYSKGNF